MTQEQKELLLKDLCARLSYYPKIKIDWEDIGGFGTFDETLWTIDAEEYLVNDRHIEDIKPYLRPMSSMTEEDRAEMGKAIQKDRIEPYGEIKSSGVDNLLLCSCRQSTNFNDWLNAHHFDYRGLIEKGLAIEVTKENNPYKK